MARTFDRKSFLRRNDFVGHRVTVVSSVRLLPVMIPVCDSSLLLLQKSAPKLLSHSGRAPGSSVPHAHSAVAIGSADGDVSVWLTGEKMPLVVLQELFQYCVLDQSWGHLGG